MNFGPPFTLRKASLEDVDAIYNLLQYFAERKLLLPKTKDQLFHQIRSFRVIYSANQLVGSAQLDIFTSELAEVKSLAVHEDFHCHGLGRLLVEDCEKEAMTMKVKNIFALTYQVKFFEKLNYRLVDIQSLPEKVFKECVVCPFYGACNENALLKNL